jgi:hypothetical protein
LLSYDSYDGNLDSLNNFSNNLGLAWHLVSKYNEEKALFENINKYKPYSVTNFLAKEAKHTNEDQVLHAVKSLANGYLNKAAEELCNITQDKKKADDFLKQTLLPLLHLDTLVIKKDVN